MGEGKEPSQFSGTEAVRSLGGHWIVGESRGPMPDGEMGISLLSLGYDASAKHFVGTWIGSMMPTMWIYRGELNESGTELTLSTEGPDMADPAKTRPYRDIVIITGPGERQLVSEMQTENGEWQRFMTCNYRRKG